jgi:integrase
VTWGLTQETQKGVKRWVIKRWNPEKGCPERLPVVQYEHFRDDEPELRAFVKRINAPLSAKSKVEFKHAFINDDLLDEYLDFLQTKISTQSVALTNRNYLKNYVLNFFIGKLDLMNPNDWIRQENQTAWAKFLLSDKSPKAAKTKRTIINEANRFLYWLSDKRNGEIRFKKLEPLTKKRLQTIEAERELRGEIKDRKLISDEHWKTILKNPPKHIYAAACLGYHYGFRRSEALGVLDGDVKQGYILVERQLRKIGQHGILKGKLKRKVNHWFSTAKDAYKWVKAVQSYPKHPTTLSVEWAKYMRTLKLDYDFHDLRHTFITKAVRKHNIRDVQLAAGHKHISVTMGYLHDDRTLDDETFTPEAD